MMPDDQGALPSPARPAATGRTSAGRGLRAALAVLACATLALGGLGLWRWLRPATPAAAMPALADAPGSAGGETPGGIALRLRLLPEGGAGADPASVRIGIAEVAEQDAAAWRTWVRSGMQGAGPQAYADLATVVRWVDARAQRAADPALEAGTVEVGPLRLPEADAHVLQAASADRLRWYDARFTRDRIPDTLRPRLASGLRVEIAGAEIAGAEIARTEIAALDAGRAGTGGSRASPARIALQLRRVEGSRDAEWQPLLRRVAPEVLAAYDDTPLTLPAQADGPPMVAPLPPGPVDAVVLIEGVEVLRRRLMLVPGQLTTLAVDGDSLRRGAALATSLRLRFVEAGSGTPLRPAELLWLAPDGERRLPAEADGSYRIARVDPARPLRFDLRMAPTRAEDGADALPAWPDTVPVVLRLDGSAQDTDMVGGMVGGINAQTGKGPVELLRTVALEPLRWLVVDGLPAEARLRGDRMTAPAANAGTPPPVHVLERAESRRAEFGRADSGRAGSRRADADPVESGRSGAGRAAGRGEAGLVGAGLVEAGLGEAGRGESGHGEDVWRAVAAERFVARPSGVAVSIQAPGRYRLAVAVSPWRILRSAAVEVAPSGKARSALPHAGLLHAGLLPQPRASRTVRVRLLGASGPLLRTPVQVLDAAGALPPWTLSTDSAGWLRLDAVTEPTIRVEAPGHAQAELALDAAEVTLRLRPERD